MCGTDSNQYQPLSSVSDVLPAIPFGVATHEVICDSAGVPCDYRFLDVNNAFEEMLGISAADLVGKSVLEVFPETEPYWIKTWGNVALNGKPAHLEGFFKSAGRHFDAHGFNIGEGRFAVVFSDVSERKNTENEVAIADSKRRIILDSLVELVILQDLEMRVLWANRAAADSVGKPLDEMIGRACHEIWHGSDEPCTGCPVVLARQTGKDHTGEVKTPDGRLWQVRGVPTPHDGKVSAVVEITRDITELKLRERQIIEGERKYRSLFETAGDAIFTAKFTDRGPVITDCNQRAVEMFGWTKEEMVGMSPSELSPRLQPDGAFSDDQIGRNVAAAMSGEPVHVDWIHQRKDGTPIVAEVTIGKVPLGEENWIQGIVRDVGEKHRAVEALRRSEERYRSIFETAGDALFTLQCTDEEALFTDCNQRAAEMFGLERDEIIGASPADISPPNQPDGRTSEEAARGHISAALTGARQEFRWTHRRKDGTPFATEVTLNRMMASDQEVVQASVRDVSERLEQEEQKRELEARIQAAQRTESLSVLAGGVAHDFNNLLTGVLGNAELALQDLHPGSPARENVERIRKSALRAADLARQMLAYSGRGQFVLVAVDLSEIVREIRHLLESSVSKSAVLEFQLHEPLPAVEVDVTQVRQALVALLTNASEALESPGGKILISSGVDECEPQSVPGAPPHTGSEPTPHAYLEVTDTGAGMDEDTVERMFDPFFTTKFAGRGLGLSAVLGIVRGHNGTIKVDSEAGQGTTIRMCFPISQKPARQVRKTPPGRQERLLGKTVLIVDDEPAVLEVGKLIVERAGATVLTATNGIDAEKVFAENSQAIDCVLLDLTMPGISGEDTLQRLRQLRKNVCVILSSGYNQEELEEQFGGKGFAGFLQKPYKQNRLLATLGDAIEG